MRQEVTSQWHHYQKQKKNADICETKQSIHHSKGIDKSYPKMYFLLNLIHYVSSYGHLYQILAFLRCPLSKYGHVTWPKKQISKKFYFLLILHYILGKVTKFRVEKLSTSEIISQKPLGGGKNPTPVLLGLRYKVTSKAIWNKFVTQQKLLTYQRLASTWIANQRHVILQSTLD